MKARGIVGGATLAAALVVVFVCGGAAFGQNDPNKRGDDSGPAVQYDVSQPLSAECSGQTTHDGYATAVYDPPSNRWIFQQFSVSSTPFLDCVAVSTSGDPTGSYARYAFSYSNFPGYPKLGVWPDGYYVTF